MNLTLAIPVLAVRKEPDHKSELRNQITGVMSKHCMMIISDG
jgi:hypothetical protein